MSEKDATIIAANTTLIKTNNKKREQNEYWRKNNTKAR